MAVEQYGAVLAIEYLGQQELQRYAADLQRAGAITEEQVERMLAAWNRGANGLDNWTAALRGMGDALQTPATRLATLTRDFERFTQATDTGLLQQQIQAVTTRLDAMIGKAQSGARALNQMRAAYAELASLAGVIQEREYQARNERVALAQENRARAQGAIAGAISGPSAALLPAPTAPLPVPVQSRPPLPPPTPRADRLSRIDDRLESWITRMERRGVAASLQYGAGDLPVSASTRVLGMGQTFSRPAGPTPENLREFQALSRDLRAYTDALSGAVAISTESQRRTQARELNQARFSQWSRTLDDPEGTLAWLGSPDAVGAMSGRRGMAIRKLLEEGSATSQSLGQIFHTGRSDGVSAAPDYANVLGWLSPSTGRHSRTEWMGQGRQFRQMPGLVSWRDPQAELGEWQQVKAAREQAVRALRGLVDPAFTSVVDLLNTAAQRMPQALPSGPLRGGTLVPSYFGTAYGRFGDAFGGGFGAAYRQEQLLAAFSARRLPPGGADPLRFGERGAIQYFQGLDRIESRPGSAPRGLMPVQVLPEAFGRVTPSSEAAQLQAQRVLQATGGDVGLAAAALQQMGRTAEQARAALGSFAAGAQEAAQAARQSASADRQEAAASVSAARLGGSASITERGIGSGFTPRGATITLVAGPDGVYRPLPAVRQGSTQPPPPQAPRPAFGPLVPLAGVGGAGAGGGGFGGAGAGGAGGGGGWRRLPPSPPPPPPYQSPANPVSPNYRGFLRGNFDDFQTGFRGRGELPYAQQIGQAFKFSVFYGASYSLLFQMSQVLRQALDEAVQFQQALTELSIVTGQSVDYNRDLANRLGEIATRSGFSSFQGVEAGTRGIGLFDLLDAPRAEQEAAAQTSARVTSQLGFTTGREFQSIQLDVGAIAQAFDLGYQAQSRIQDVDAFFTKRFGLLPGSTLETTAQIGTLGRDAGFSLEEVAALAAKIQSRTGQTPAAAAGLLSQFFGRSGDPALLQRLRNIGIDTEGGFRPAIEQLAIKTPDLSPNERAEVLNAFGRGRSAGAAKIIVEDLAEITAEAQRAQVESQGLGQQQFEERIANIGGQLAQLTGSLNEFAKALGDAGLISMTSALVEGFTALVQSTTGVLELFSGLPGPMEAFIVALGLAITALKSQTGGQALLSLSSRRGYLPASPIGGGPAGFIPAGQRLISVPTGRSVDAQVPYLGSSAPVTMTQNPVGAGLAAAPTRGLATAGRALSIAAGTLINPITIAVGGLLAIGQIKQEADDFAIALAEGTGALTSTGVAFSGFETPGVDQLRGLASNLQTAADNQETGALNQILSQMASFFGPRETRTIREPSGEPVPLREPMTGSERAAARLFAPRTEGGLTASLGTLQPGYLERVETVRTLPTAQARADDMRDRLERYVNILNEAADRVEAQQPKGQGVEVFGGLNAQEIGVGLETLSVQGYTAKERLDLLSEAISNAGTAASNASALFDEQSFALDATNAISEALKLLPDTVSFPTGIPEGFSDSPLFRGATPSGAAGINSWTNPIGALIAGIQQTARLATGQPQAWMGTGLVGSTGQDVDPLTGIASQDASRFDVGRDDFVKAIMQQIDPASIYDQALVFLRSRDIEGAPSTSQGREFVQLLTESALPEGALGLGGENLDVARQAMFQALMRKLAPLWVEAAKELDPNRILSREEATAQVAGLVQTNDLSVAQIPKSDFESRIQVQQDTIASIEAVQSRTADGAGTGAMIEQIAEIRAAIAEDEVAKLDLVRRSQQAAATSADQVMNIGRQFIQEAITAAVQGGNADLLAQLVENAGSASIQIARKAIEDAVAVARAAAQSARRQLAAAREAIRVEQESRAIIDGWERGMLDRIAANTPEGRAADRADVELKRREEEAERLLRTLERTPSPRDTSDSVYITGSDAPLRGSVQSQFDDMFADEEGQETGPTAAQVAAARQAALAARDDRIAQARAQIASARADMAAADSGSMEYWSAYGALRDAQFALSQAEGDRASAVAQADAAFRGGQLAAAEASIRTASEATRRATRGTTAYYQALASYYQAQEQLRDAMRSYQRNLDILASDVTDPVDQARVAVNAASRRLRQEQARGAGADVIAEARVEQRQTQAQLEAARFQQRLNDVQFAERMGRMSHAQYINYLDNERRRLNRIGNRSRQQVEQLQQIDSLLKEATEQMQGQFNVGDVRLPTPYEVRRYIQAGGGQNFQQAPTVNNISIDGTDTRAVEALLRQLLGESAFATTTSVNRKV